MWILDFLVGEGYLNDVQDLTHWCQDNNPLLTETNKVWVEGNDLGTAYFVVKKKGIPVSCQMLEEIPGIPLNTEEFLLSPDGERHCLVWKQHQKRAYKEWFAQLSLQ